MTDALLSVENLTVRFGGVTALRQVALSVSRGEFVGLIGPNGAGKTTLLRAVTGLCPHVEGRIAINGRELRRERVAARVRLGVAMSHQIVRPFRNLTLLENVMLAAGHERTMSPARALFSFNRIASQKRALALLRLLAIDHVAGESPDTQPLGVLKRLEVARALAVEPHILFLDEPLAGLGQIEAARMGSLLRELNRTGATIVLVEHNLGEAQRICERFIVLDNGEKIADGPVADVLKDERVISAYLGEGWRGAGTA